MVFVTGNTCSYLFVTWHNHLLSFLWKGSGQEDTPLAELVLPVLFLSGLYALCIFSLCCCCNRVWQSGLMGKETGDRIALPRLLTSDCILTPVF
jgi:hypothetical protein